MFFSANALSGRILLQRFVATYLYPALVIVGAYHTPIWLLGQEEEQNGFREVPSVEQTTDWPQKLNYEDPSPEPFDFNVYSVSDSDVVERFGGYSREMSDKLSADNGGISSYLGQAHSVVYEGIYNRLKRYQGYFRTSIEIWDDLSQTELGATSAGWLCSGMDYLLEMPVSRLMGCEKARPGERTNKRKSTHEFAEVDSNPHRAWVRVRQQIERMSS